MPAGGEEGSSPPIEGVLYRRITQLWLTPMPEEGQFRLSSQAFTDRRQSGAMSVVLPGLMIARGLDPVEGSLAGWDGYGLVAIDLLVVEECGLTITVDETDENPGHALVFGKKTGSVRNRLRKAAQWIVWPNLPPWQPPG